MTVVVSNTTSIFLKPIQNHHYTIEFHDVNGIEDCIITKWDGSENTRRRWVDLEKECAIAMAQAILKMYSAESGLTSA